MHGVLMKALRHPAFHSQSLTDQPQMGGGVGKVPSPHTASFLDASADEDNPKLAVKETKEAKGKGKSTGFVPSSAHFISFDADDTTEKKKRKAAGAGAGEEAAKSKKAGKSKVVEKEESDDDDGDSPSPKAKPSKGKRAGGKKK